jgi:hypothetical protein
MRVSALWGHQKAVVLFAKVLFVLNFLCQVIILSYNYATAITIPYLPPFTGCLIIPTFPKLWVIFLAGMTFDTSMVTLTVIRSFPMVRGQGIQMSLWTLLLRDGLIYYFCVIASQILSIIVILAPIDISISIPIMSCYPPIVVVAIACNRLLIRLEMQLQGEKNDDHTTDIVSARIFSNDDFEGGHNTPRAFDYNGKKRQNHDPLATELSNL